METRQPTIIIVLYALLALLTVPVFPHFMSPNEFSRWIVAAAIVDDHTFDVTGINKRFGDRIEDLSRVEGRQYSNKVPGVALVGLPGYAVARLLTGSPRPETMRITLTAMRWLASTLPVILLACFFLRGARSLGVDEPRLRWLVGVLLFATPLFSYGMLLFSHALAAFALFGAWVLLFTDTFGRRPALAGTLMGISVLAEYTSAAVVVLFLVCAAIGSRRDLVRCLAGGLPFLLVLLLYNQLAFGNPFSVSYLYTENADYRALARSGLLGLHPPSLGTLMSLLFDPSRGLLVMSPVLVCALSGFAARRHLSKPAFWSLVCAPILLLIIFSCYPYWHGGWGLGARYLTPALPFLVLLIAFGDMSFGTMVLTGMSVAAVVTVSLVFPFVPPFSFPLPWGTLAWPILQDGLVAPNMLHFIARPIAIAVPFLLVIAAIAISIPMRWWIAFAAGAITTLAVGILYSASTPSLVMSRGYFEEVYFDQRGALTRHLPKDVVVQPNITRHMADELKSPPPSWPF